MKNIILWITLVISTTLVAQECEQSETIDLVKTPYTSHWDAYDQLICLEKNLIAKGDRRAIFLSVYALTTYKVGVQVDAGYFNDTVWIEEYQLEFANQYRRAFYDYESGNRSKVPKVWRVAFDASKSGNTLIVQDILLGMNAHINFDLAYTLRDVDIKNNRSAKYEDHNLVNNVLSDIVGDITVALSEIYGSNYAAIDVALGDIDDQLIGTGMVAAREQAWNNARKLTDYAWWRQPFLQLRIQEEAMLITNATMALSLTPLLNAALSAAEGSNPNSSFCDNFPCRTRAHQF